MSKPCPVLSVPFLFLSVWLVPPTVAQQQPSQQGPASFKVEHIIGLEGAKQNSKGKVTVSKAAFEFASGTTKKDLAINSIEDALTGADSQRMIGGTVGTLSMFAPYGSGRFLSLFRTKIDSLTITYRDANGGLHGAIFTLPEGQAAVLKRQMVAEGAKTSISVEEEANQQTNGKKPQEKKQ